MLHSQNISVADFQYDETDQTANIEPNIVYDRNGEKCALIKIETTQTGFQFDVGALSVEKTVYKTGEIWLYVQAGVKRITISHNQLGMLRNFDLGMTLKKARTYIMRLTTGQIQTSIVESLTKQFLVFDVVPTNATIEVEGEPWPVDAEGHAEKNLSFGIYNYKVMAPDYHSSVGRIDLKDPNNKHIERVVLKPNFGWIQLKDDAGIAGADVYLDNQRIGQVPMISNRLKSGNHKIKIIKPLYKMFEQDVVVTDGDTTIMSPRMEADFAETTFKVEADAEIWIDGVKKGTRTWTGPLETGEYLVECKMAGHRTTSKRVRVTRNTVDEILLPAPIPIYGFLEITSSPSSAKVSLDGKDMGETPLILNNIIVGKHNIVVSKQNYRTETREVTVLEGKTESVLVQLNNMCNIRVSPSVTTASVYVDGHYKGDGTVEMNIASGKHKVKLVADGYYILEEEINVDGQTPTYYFTMKSNQAVITVKSNRYGSLSVDGQYVGSTSSYSPKDVLLKNGTHNIKVQYRHFKGEKNIYVGGKDQTVYIKMQRDNIHDNAFYIEGNYQTGALSAAGGTIGMYIGKWNFEGSYLFGMEDEETVYWHRTDFYDNFYSYEEYYSPEYIIVGKVGYGIRLGNRVRFTPQIGCGFIDLGNANSFSGIISLKMSLALSSWTAITLTPEYSFSAQKSDLYKVLADISPKINGWDNGFNLKLGFMIYL